MEEYWIESVDEYRKGIGYLYNRDIYLKIDHKGRADAHFLQPMSTPYAEGLRCAYVKDEQSGLISSAPHLPASKEPDSFRCGFLSDRIVWEVEHDTLRMEATVTIPWEDRCEIWDYTLTNTGPQTRSISLYPGFFLSPPQSIRIISRWEEDHKATIFEYWPRLPNVSLEKTARRMNLTAVIPSEKPDSWECEETAFLGHGERNRPDAITRETLDNTECYHAGPIAFFQYRRSLAANESFSVRLAIAPLHNRSELARIRERYVFAKAPPPTYCSLLKQEAVALHLDSPDTAFNNFVNHSLPKQVTFNAVTYRHTYNSNVRNAIQDAMGMSALNPEEAKRIFHKVWTVQDKSGWLHHGLSLHPDEPVSDIKLKPHRDMNVWGPIALDFYLRETGDFAILDDIIPFTDDAAGASLYDHIVLGLEWLLNDRTDIGLSRIGVGDWNDVLDGVGVQGKGESVWLSQALVCALRCWIPVAESRGDSERANRWSMECEQIKTALQTFAWREDAGYFARGRTDNGRWFGIPEDREGRIFLNTQTWAIMSRTCDDHQNRRLIASVEENLMTDRGPLTLAPAFTRYQKDLGRITIKTPGMTENGSVYCHAAIFYANSLYRIGEKERAWKVMSGLLPKPGDRSDQPPVLFPNFYFGPAAQHCCGLSSTRPETGTAAWFYVTLLEEVLGLRGTFDGLEIKPQLPSEWKHLTARRHFRKASIDVEMVRKETITETKVFLDEAEIQGPPFIPHDKLTGHHKLRVVLPA